MPCRYPLELETLGCLKSLTLVKGCFLNSTAIGKFFWTVVSQECYARDAVHLAWVKISTSSNGFFKSPGPGILYS